MLKAAIKYSTDEDQVRHRVVPPDAVTRYVDKLETLRGEIAEIMKEEKGEKLVCWADVSPGVPLISPQLRQAEMELKKSQNILEHGDEIYARPARTWFQSEKEKQEAKGTFAMTPGT